MSPYETIYAKSRELQPGEDFGVRVGHYLQNGFVFSTPDFFAMGEAATVDKENNNIAFVPSGDAKGNAWFIAAFAGDMSKCWNILPRPMGNIAFERIREGKRDLQIYSTESLRRLSRHELTPILAEA